MEGLVSVVWRARTVLPADGIGTMTIVRLVGKSKVRWQERYLAKGIAGLRRDATRPGRKPPLSAEVIERVVHKTLHGIIRKIGTPASRVWKRTASSRGEDG